MSLGDGTVLRRSIRVTVSSLGINREIVAAPQENAA